MMPVYGVWQLWYFGETCKGCQWEQHTNKQVCHNVRKHSVCAKNWVPASGSAIQPNASYEQGVQASMTVADTGMPSPAWHLTTKHPDATYKQHRQC